MPLEKLQVATVKRFEEPFQVLNKVQKSNTKSVPGTWKNSTLGLGSTIRKSHTAHVCVQLQL